MCNFLRRPLNIICLFTEIYWSVDEVILKQYWTVVYSDFEEVSNKYYVPEAQFMVV
jgi:hypothetical protein